ncbi:MAG: RNA-binding protein [Candidatus Paceibacterota bacterium]
MAKKLYVGGLPYSTTEDELREAFSQAGSVDSASIIMDRMSGRSKGFGFVEMTSEEEAQKAIELWNGKDFGGRTLTVNEARPMEERPRSTGGFRGGNDRGGSGGGYGGGSRGGNGGGGRSW